jgi:hypothetical protein
MSSHDSSELNGNSTAAGDESSREWGSDVFHQFVESKTHKHVAYEIETKPEVSSGVRSIFQS